MLAPVSKARNAVAKKKSSRLLWIIVILTFIWLIGNYPENIIGILFCFGLVFYSYKYYQKRNAAASPTVLRHVYGIPLDEVQSASIVNATEKPISKHIIAPVSASVSSSVLAPVSASLSAQKAIQEHPKTAPGTEPGRPGFQIPPPPMPIGTPAATRSTSHPGKWIPDGESIEIHGMRLNLGMLYFGNDLHSGGGMIEPALIDPAKPVAKYADLTAPLTTYWPSYATMSPEARKAYLLWLADGKKHPDANIGYVFLYFYGLERRIFVDGATDKTALADRPAIILELRRLAQIYSHQSNSFRQYCSHLLEFLELACHSAKLYEKPVPPLAPGFELPFYLRIAIGQAVLAGAPIPPHIASAWVEFDPAILRRTAATRCKNEFLALFQIKYQETYGAGLKFPANRTRLKYQYHPASAGLLHSANRSFDLDTDIGKLPDITALTTPIKKLQAIVDTCSDELDGYSRFIGKNPDRHGTTEALLHLPPSIWPAPSRANIDKLKAEVQASNVCLPIQDLIARFGTVPAISKDCLRGLARILAAQCIGMEPDLLVGSKTPKPEDFIVLFDNPAGAPARASAGYAAAEVTVELAAAVAHADGDFSDSELAVIDKHIAAWRHLHPAQKNRLQAHARLLQRAPRSLSSLKKKIEPLDADTRTAIANFAASMAQADGVVTPEEVKLLEKMYKLLGIEQQKVYDNLHSASTVRTTVTSMAQNDKAGSPFTLDINKIEKLKTESAALDAILSDIFNDETETPREAIVTDWHIQVQNGLEQETIAMEEPTALAKRFLGLDASHAAFGRMLISRPSWSRIELEDVALDLEVMLDGALEQVNEATLDAFGLCCTEGDDPIEINSEILEKISI